VYRDIILVLEGDVEFLPVLDDIDTDVEVGCSDLVLLKECIQLIGGRKRAIVEAETHDPRGRIPYLTGNATAICPRADLGAIRVKRAISGIGGRIALMRYRNVRDRTSLYGIVEGIRPGLWYSIRIRTP
jgi:hypothetical protein